jgi:monoamine oxidase
MAKKIDFRDVFEMPEAERMDEMSLAEWVRQNSESQTTIDAIDVATKNTFGMASKRLSLLCFLYYVRCSGSLSEIFGAEGGGAQSMRVKGGMQQISKIMAQQLGESRVRLRTAVTNVDCGQNELRVSAISTDGKYTVSLIRCKRLILAIPPSEAGKIRYSQPLPYLKRQLFDCAPPGNLLKFIITYPKAFWRTAGLSGEIVSTGEIEGDPDNVLPIVQTYDATTNHGNPAIVGFLHNDIWTEKTMDERRVAVIEDLVRFLGEEARNYIDYIDKDWHQELFNGGCPGACVPTGNMEALMSIREPVDRIHFAGTESATHWPGFVSGAVQSGLRAAHEILCHISPQSVKQKLLEGSVYEQTEEESLEDSSDKDEKKKKSSAKDDEPSKESKKAKSDENDGNNNKKLSTAASMVDGMIKWRSHL